MQCKNCNKLVPDDQDARFCMGCGTALAIECQNCGKELSPDAKFCMSCGTAVGQTAESETQSNGSILGYCAGSGVAIQTSDKHFKCSDCNKLYTPDYRFEKTSICQNCASDQGMLNVLQLERQKREAEIQQRLDVERKQIKNDFDQRYHQLKTELLQEQANRQEAETKIQDAKQQQEQAAAEQKAREAAERQHREQLKLGITEEDWVDIPAGDFIMGSPEHEPERGNHERQHNVTVSAFKLLKTPVTFAMYDAYCDATGKDKPRDEGWGRDKRPVINVSYWDAVDYAQWLSEQTGWHCGLPTEAEWEYACRAGTQTPFSTGQNISAEQANYNGNYPYNNGPKGRYWEKTTPVAHYAPNPWGLYDMHGNVQEWCASEYDEGYSGLEQQDTSGDRSNSSARVLRGGSWGSLGTWLRSAARHRNDPGDRNHGRGFRLTRM